MTLEELAVQWRADTGVVPYELWVALTDEERARLQSLTQTAAQRMVATAGTRVATPKIESVALADMVARSKTP